MSKKKVKTNKKEIDSDSSFEESGASDEEYANSNEETEPELVVEPEHETEPEPTDEFGENEDENMLDKEHSKNENDEVKLPTIHSINFIKNKLKRNELFKKFKLEKNKKKKQERRARRKAGLPRSTGNTIESLRETDQTTIVNQNEDENAELQNELEQDDFSSYFAGSYTPRILITFADNPQRRTRKFGVELSRIIPNSLVKVRNRSSVKNIVKSALKSEYTDVIIINEDRHKPNGLLVIHLPSGPTFHFKLSNMKITTDMRRSHKEFTKHRPEVVLTNFTTRLGLTVGRMFGALFNHDPEFRGRRVVTFHNQRDFIFFRHHRYEFTKDGKRAKLRELGPEFTLKLRSIQEGTFDSKTGDYAWIQTNKRHSLEGRRRFYL